ncbi:hypothetical protein Adt_45772 [Abeliophyllum distichum]|uniref:Uncharacterized protein n=1 Tax=Abeliophyllum distichum TaxID=126358 RepID=A0ABD1PFC0_9LAMI
MCTEVMKVWQANGKRPLPIAFDQPIRNNAKYFTRVVGKQVRFTMLPCYLHEQRMHSYVVSSSGTPRPSSGRDYESFWTFHTFRDDNWVNPQTAGDYVASSGASLDELAIAKEVLGERQGHVRGVGLVPNYTSPSLDSTAASKAPQRTFHQFFGDPQNDDPRFAMYEAQLRRMNTGGCACGGRHLGRGQGFGGSIDF